MTFQWPSWVHPLPFPFPELHNNKIITTYKIIQEPLCTFHELECVNKIKVDTSSCLKPCSGLIVTSLIKSDSDKKLENLLPDYVAYNKYKKITQYPSGSDGKIMQYPKRNIDHMF